MRCSHFDFGDQLRRAAHAPSVLSAGDQAHVRYLLQTGGLLEDEVFGIAETILSAYLRNAHTGCNLLVLNGLPRHIGQARAVAKFAHVGVVWRLTCTPDVVLERLRTNAGGDRAQRVDDDPALVARKLATYEGRTAPLAAYYQERGVPVQDVPIGTATTPEKIAHQLSAPPAPL